MPPYVVTRPQWVNTSLFVSPDATLPAPSDSNNITISPPKAGRAAPTRQPSGAAGKSARSAGNKVKKEEEEEEEEEEAATAKPRAKSTKSTKSDRSGALGKCWLFWRVHCQRNEPQAWLLSNQINLIHGFRDQLKITLSIIFLLQLILWHVLCHPHVTKFQNDWGKNNRQQGLS